MKTIQLFGTEYKVAFNLAVQRTFEAMTGKDFDLALLAHQEHRINLYISIIIANNDMDSEAAAEFTRKFLFDATFEDLKNIDALANEVIAAWYNIPPSTNMEPASESDSKNA